jgi:DNA-binding MltR family transcriptional regulator
VRSVSRFTNEEGTFMRLKMDLQKIGQEYGVSEDDINDIFFEVSCSKTKLIEHLKG